MRVFILSIMAAGFALSPRAYAADEPAKPTQPEAGKPAARAEQMSPEARMKQMKELLNLTDDQQAKMQVIFAQAREKARVAREEGKGNGREVMKGMFEEINAVLTPEQQAKWKEELQKRRAERAAGGAAKAPEKP